MRKIVLYIILALTLIAPTVSAQTYQDAQEAIGPVELNNPDLELGAETGAQRLTRYVVTIINTALFAGLVATLVFFTMGGIKWITAGGDPKVTQQARETITSALIGILLLSVAFIMGRIAQEFIGNPPATPPSGPPP